MADTDTAGSTSSSSRPRKGTRGQIVDVAQGATVVDPRGNVRTMGGDKYVLDQPGRHVVDGQPYDVTEAEK